APASRASPHVAGLTWPSPLRPLRIAGYSRRSGPYTRSPNRRALAQMYPSVTGFLREPSMVTILPFWTVTARLHASGQSGGHAVSTTAAGPLRIGSDMAVR